MISYLSGLKLNLKSFSGQNLNDTLPTICCLSINPNALLSLLTSRLSPNTKYLFLGITLDLG